MVSSVRMMMMDQVLKMTLAMMRMRIAMMAMTRGGDSESQPSTQASRQGQDDHFNRHHHHPHQDHGLVFR